MPLIPGARALIEIPISDLVIAGTTVKRKARFTKLIHEQVFTGECLALIEVYITLYAEDESTPDGFGPALTKKGFTTFSDTLSADNQTVVDAMPGATAGDILAIRQGETEAAWQAKLTTYEVPVMLQGDFFEYLRDNEPVLIGAMIRKHILNADAMGKYNAN